LHTAVHPSIVVETQPLIVCFSIGVVANRPVISEGIVVFEERIKIFIFIASLVVV
jgi:hypothetical protein